MDLNSGTAAHYLGKSTGNKLEAMVPEPVCGAMPHYCMESGIKQKNLEGGRRCRVSVADCINIFFKTGKHKGKSLLSDKKSLRHKFLCDGGGKKTNLSRFHSGL